jgi:hypothetical protein
MNEAWAIVVLFVSMLVFVGYTMWIVDRRKP